jgi:uncharacterized protein (TIGR01319 family)
MITRDQKLLIDFGSTFTKVVVVDLKQECIVARSQAISTVSVDASLGLKSALQIALGETVETVDATQYIASSSAAGGLRMICSGFVPELSSEAAARVALGAGAKVVHTFSHKLTKSELEAISKLNPDIILLCGGTDGGNSDVLLHNAKAIASSKHLIGSVLIAGNKDAHDEIDGIFALAGKPVLFCENVLPEIGKLNPDHCNGQIRELFIRHIVKAKGIREDVLMPTPLAVLNAAKLLAEGIPGESGLGELAIVDVGGSTTDVVSIAEQRTLSPNTIVRGLPEPYAKRTVEGDLGVRFSLDKITEMAARGTGAVDDDFIRYCNFVSNSARLPSNDIERAFDSQLATQAAKEAFERHVGRIEVLHTFSGELACQYGKNLTGIKNVIGTGGPIVFSNDARKILEVVSYDSNFPLLLKPKSPRFWVDQYYILYAMGLLAVSFPEAAFRIMKNCLKQI